MKAADAKKFPVDFFASNIRPYLTESQASQGRNDRIVDDSEDRHFTGALHQIASSVKTENVYTRDALTGECLIPDLIEILRQVSALGESDLMSHQEPLAISSSERLRTLKKRYVKIQELHLRILNSKYLKIDAIKGLNIFSDNTMTSVVTKALSALKAMNGSNMINPRKDQQRVVSFFQDKEPLSCSVALAAFASKYTATPASNTQRPFSFYFIDDAYMTVSATTAAALGIYRDSKPALFGAQQSVVIYTDLGCLNRNANLDGLPHAYELFFENNKLFPQGSWQIPGNDDMSGPVFMRTLQQIPNEKDRQDHALKFPASVFVVKDRFQFLLDNSAPTDVCFIGSSDLKEVYFLLFWLALTNKKVERLHMTERHFSFFEFDKGTSLLSIALSYIIDKDVRLLQISQSDESKVLKSKEKYSLRCYELSTLRNIPGI